MNERDKGVIDGAAVREEAVRHGDVLRERAVAHAAAVMAHVSGSAAPREAPKAPETRVVEATQEEGATVVEQAPAQTETASV